MNPTITIKTMDAGLDPWLSELAAVTKVDAAAVARIESGQLAWRIAQEFGPNNYASGRNKVIKNVKRILYPMPPKPFPQAKQGNGDVRWLFAGPNFVAGVPLENNKLDHSTAEAVKTYYRHRARGDLAGAKWRDVGKRGKNQDGQHVMLLNRLLVSKRVFTQVLASINANIGQAKASFAFTTSQNINKRIPGWISKHFPTRAKGKAIYNAAGLQGDKPFMEFGSRAPGVVNNPRMADAITSAAKQSAKLLKAKVEKVLKGYAYDSRTGSVFKPKAGQFEEN